MAKRSASAKKQKPLFEPASDSEASQNRLHLIIDFKKMSEKVSLKPVRLAIPHPFRKAKDANLSVCILTKDPQRLYKDAITPLKLESIKKISGISKLRAKFAPFEAKRRLCAAFDLFVADSSIMPMLPKLLGKKFFDKKKNPVPFSLTKLSPETVSRELTNTIEATYMFCTGGSNTSICVGVASQSQEEITANIEAVIRKLGGKLQGGLNNIRSIHIKTKDSIALPIYVREAAAPLKASSSSQAEGGDSN